MRYTFDSRDGTPVEAQVVSLGEKIDAPTSTRDGWQLAGWSYQPSRTGQQKSLFDFENTPATTSIAFVAQWRRPTSARHSVWFNPCNDSSALPAITVDHGSKISSNLIPAGITREGHEFQQWYKDSDCRHPWDFDHDVVSSDTMLYAGWTKKAYKVNFVDTDGTPLAPTQDVIYGSQVTRPEDPTADCYVLRGWHEDGDAEGWPYAFTKPVTHDLTLIAMWSLRTYGVTFDGAGGTLVPGTLPQLVEHGGKVTRPGDPTRDGYEFLGWYLDDSNEPYDFDAPVAEALLLRAAWRRSVASDPGGSTTDPTTHTVIFDTTEGGGNVETCDVAYGTPVSCPQNPQREGYVFIQWLRQTDAEPYDFDDPVTEDIALVASWARLCTVTFDSAGATAVQSQVVVEGHVAREPEVPQYDAYHSFGGWYEDGAVAPYDFDAVVTDDLTLTAHWDADEYAVTFDTGEGSSPVEAQTVEAGSYALEPVTPTLPGRAFQYWYADDAAVPYDFGTPVSAAFVLHAAWANVPAQYYVHFDTGGGSEVDSQAVAPGECMSFFANPTKEGGHFAGWFQDDSTEPYDTSTPVTQNLFLRAHWVEETSVQHTVTFDTNSVTSGVIPAQRIADGGQVVKPGDPTREGYEFEGWYELLPEGSVSQETLDANPALRETLWESGNDLLAPYDFATSVLSDVVLRARWSEAQPLTHTVSFDTQGGSELSAVLRAHGASLGAIRRPLRAGYVFAGWMDGTSELSDPASLTVVDDMTLAARWAVPANLTVVFDANGGSTVESQDVAYGMVATEPDDPVYEGHDFDGWWEVLPEGAVSLEQVEALWEQDKSAGSMQADSVAVTKTDRPLELALAVPQALRGGGAGRTFYVLRLHDGKVAVVATGMGDSLDLQSDRFSTYLLAYADKDSSGTDAQGTDVDETGARRVSSASSQSALPKTGDNTPVAAVLLLALLAATSIAAGAFVRRARPQR